MVWLPIISFVIMSWGFLYKGIHTRKYLQNNPPINLSSPFTLNGCGTSILGGYHINNSEMKVYYVMLTIFFLPFLPVGAIIAKRKGTEAAFLGIDTKYDIYGSTPFNFWEILSCYTLRWGTAGFILSILLTISS